MNQGATFKKFDLHLHTPGAGQYFTMPNGEAVPSTPEEKLAFARRYVRQAREEAKLDAIAITNHNDTSWIDPLRQAAKELYEKAFVVFPGVEIAADSGKKSIHVLAIFAEDVPVKTLERLLDEDLELTPDKRFCNPKPGDENSQLCPAPCSKSFTDVVRSIEARGGLAIAAHVFSNNGLLASKSNAGLTRQNQFRCEHLRGIQINEGKIEDLPEWERRVVTNRHKDFKRTSSIACLNASDARRLEDIGTWFTYVKCEQPSFSSLKNALSDPCARLRLRDDPPPEPACYLSALRLIKQDGFNTTGFLRELDLQFNPCLNCLIGARGTGKSALVELLRYLWEIEPLLPKELQGFVDVFLPETGQAELEVIKNDTHYRLVRQGRNPTQVERCEADGSWSSTDLRPADLFQLQLYGQKEILYTSEHVSSQLELLDRFVGAELEQLKRKRDAFLIDLRRNREAIIAEYERVKQVEDRLKDRARVEEQLRQYQQLGIQELSSTKRLYDLEMQLWEESLAQLGQSAKALEEIRRRVSPSEIAAPDIDFQSLPNSAQLSRLRERMQRLTKDLETVWKAAEAQLTGARTDINQAHKTWIEVRDVFEAKYRKALSALPDSSPDSVLRLERERAELDRLARDVQQSKHELQTLFARRREWLRQLVKNAQEQYELRQKKAESITKRLKRIRVSVAQGRDEDWLRELWERYLRGTWLQDADYKNLIQIQSPGLLPLLALVEAADAELLPGESLYTEWLPKSEGMLFTSDALTNLAQYCGLTGNKAGKLRERIDLEARLELDEMQSLDRVKIEMNIALPRVDSAVENQNDKGKAIWRALGRRLGEGVSVGQGCTAILSVLLLESTEPLIIDQPEDDLDNRFVYREIVETLRTERGKRQMLFATHNPNIPVAGDAELIIALDVTQDAGDLHAHVLARGFVDASAVCAQLKSILEGGAAAFELRRMKYGF